MCQAGVITPDQGRSPIPCTRLNNSAVECNYFPMVGLLRYEMIGLLPTAPAHLLSGLIYNSLLQKLLCLARDKTGRDSA